MDRFVSWLDTSGFFANVAHAWPWALVTTALALISLFGIANIARRYGSNES